jgi:hypothetical protein
MMPPRRATIILRPDIDLWQISTNKLAEMLGMHYMTIRKAQTDGKFGATFVATTIASTNRRFDDLFMVVSGDGRHGVVKANRRTRPNVPSKPAPVEVVKPGDPVVAAPVLFPTTPGEAAFFNHQTELLPMMEGLPEGMAYVFREGKGTPVLAIDMEPDSEGAFLLFGSATKNNAIAVATIIERFGLTEDEIQRWPSNTITDKSAERAIARRSI